MAKRHCIPQPCKRRTCKKRHKNGKCVGTPRFAKTCKEEFRACLKETLKRTGSMKAAGQCMVKLNDCNKKPGVKRAIKAYKRAKAGR